MLWQQGYINAQTPDPADPGTIDMRKRLGGLEGDTPPRSCLSVTAPTNAQVDNLLQHAHDESYSHEVLRDEVLANHPAPTLVAPTCPTGCSTWAGVV